MFNRRWGHCRHNNFSPTWFFKVSAYSEDCETIWFHQDFPAFTTHTMHDHHDMPTNVFEGREELIAGVIQRATCDFVLSR